MRTIRGHRVYGDLSYDNSRTIPDQQFTQEIREAAEENSIIRAQTKAVRDLITSFTATIQSATDSELEIVCKEKVKKVIHKNASLFNQGDKIETYIVKGKQPSWKSIDGIVYFSQYEHSPVSELSSNTIALPRREWYETEDALAIVKKSGNNTIGYIDLNMAEKYGLKEWLENNPIF